VKQKSKPIFLYKEGKMAKTENKMTPAEQRLTDAVKNDFGGKTPASVDPGRYDGINQLARLVHPQLGYVCKIVPKGHVVELGARYNNSRTVKHTVLAYYSGEQGEAFLCSGVILFKGLGGRWQKYY
jgi:hypothetical protein